MKNNKITIVAAKDYYFGIPTINRLCQKYSSNLQSVIIIEDFFSLKRILYSLFMFNPLFILKKIIQSKKSKREFFNNLNKKKINFFFTNNINSLETYKFLKNQKSSMLVILSSPQILSKKILKIKKKNFNYHCSDLPRNRGLFPIFYTFLDHKGERLFCCLHYMNKKIDDGKIVISKVLKNKNNNLGQMYERAFYQFDIIFKDLIRDKFEVRKNITRLKTYNSYPKLKNYFKYYKILLFL
jgi:folate-dependent phosphoribosylglycinamide formyltransferase PurN